MSASDWIVAIVGLGLIVFELWFFLGSSPSSRRTGMVSRERRPANWFCALALGLAVLVPGRAFALCCFEEWADQAAHVAAQGTASNHGHECVGAAKAALVTAVSVSECEAVTGPDPLLGERNRSDGASRAGHAALPSPTIRLASVFPREIPAPADPTTSSVTRARVSHPLRL